MQAKTVVTVRVWLKIRDKVGHASLQTQNFTGNNVTYGIGDDGVYISIYPTGRGVKPTDRVGVPFKTKTLPEDENKYKRDKKPVEVNFYTLDTEAIKTEYKKLVDSGFNFSLLGSTAFKNPATHNCCSLVAHLLKIGGIDKLAENNKILNFPLGMVVSSVSTFLSWSACSYFSSSKIVLPGMVGSLFGALLSLRTTDITGDSFISIMTSSVYMSIGMLGGGALGGLGGLGIAYLEIFARADNKHLNLANLIEYGSRFLNIKGTAFLTTIVGGLILAMSSVTGMAGLLSGRVVRYATSTGYLLKEVNPILQRNLPHYVYRSIYPAIGLLAGCRMFHLANAKFDRALDFLIDGYFIYYLLKTQHGQLTLATTLAKMLQEILLTNKTTASIVTSTLSTLGENNYNQKLKYGILTGATLFGLTSCFSTSIGFYTMNRIAIQLKKLLNLTILTPTEVAEIIKCAKKIEDSKNNIKLEPSFSQLFQKIKSPIFSNSKKPDQETTISPSAQPRLLCSLF